MNNKSKRVFGNLPERKRFWIIKTMAAYSLYKFTEENIADGIFFLTDIERGDLQIVNLEDIKDSIYMYENNIRPLTSYGIALRKIINRNY